jgi:hypothetical protein
MRIVTRLTLYSKRNWFVKAFHRGYNRLLTFISKTTLSLTTNPCPDYRMFSHIYQLHLIQFCLVEIFLCLQNTITATSSFLKLSQLLP